MISNNIELLYEVDYAELHVSYTELITPTYLSDLTLCLSKYFWNAHCPDCFNVVCVSTCQKNCSTEDMKFWETLSNGL